MALMHTLRFIILLLVISALPGADASATLWNSQCRATTSATLTEIKSVLVGTLSEMYTDVTHHFVTEDTDTTNASAYVADAILKECEKTKMEATKKCEADGKENAIIIANTTSEVSQLKKTNARLNEMLASKERAHAEAIKTKAEEHKANVEWQDKLLSESQEKLTDATHKLSELSRKLQQQEKASIELEQKLKNMLQTSDYDIPFATAGVDIANLFRVVLAAASQSSSVPTNQGDPQSKSQDIQNSGSQVTQTVNGPNCMAMAKSTCAPCPPPTDQYTGPWMSNLTSWMQHFRTAITVVSKIIWYAVFLAVSLAVMTIYAIVHAFMKCLPWISSVVFPCRNCVLLEEKLEKNLEEKIHKCEELEEKVRECEELEEKARRIEAYCDGLRILRA